MKNISSFWFWRQQHSHKWLGGGQQKTARDSSAEERQMEEHVAINWVYWVSKMIE